MKKCANCQVFKNLTEFYHNKTKISKSDADCKDCRKLKVNISFRERRYGITYEDYTAMVEKQKGLCEICHKPNGRMLCCDHDHNTGANRGLLCDQCNKGLGYFCDSINILLSAASYIKKYASDGYIE